MPNNVQITLTPHTAILISEFLEGEIRALEEDDQPCPDLIAVHAHITQSLPNHD